MSSIIYMISLLLLIGHSQSDYVTSSTTLQFPPFSAPLPPVETKCYTFDLYMERSILPSLKSEDFTLLRNTATIRPRSVCETGEVSSDDKSFFCAETEIKLNYEKMCNANHRSSLIVCRKWWGEKHQELGNSTFLNDPPNPKSIVAFCIIFPNKPWCDPQEVCVWYPTIPRCQRVNLQVSLISPLSTHDDTWYIAGILKDNNYKLQNGCDISSKSVILSNDLFLRLTYPKDK